LLALFAFTYLLTCRSLTPSSLLKPVIEKSKSKEEGKIWSDIVKKISAACIAGILADCESNWSSSDPAFAVS